MSDNIYNWHKDGGLMELKRPDVLYESYERQEEIKREISHAVSAAIRDTKLSIARELNADRWTFLKTDWGQEDNGDDDITFFVMARAFEFHINCLALNAMGWEGI
jgi:hypothetical protein